MTTEPPDAGAPSAGGRVTAFLKSGTGIVTTATALIAAIAGLVTAVTQFTGGSSATPFEPAPPAPAGATIVPLETEAEAELRSHIPESIWSTCGPPTDAEKGAVASFNCRYRQIVGLQYNLFASAQELGEAYTRVKQNFGLEEALTGSACEDGAFEGEYHIGDRIVNHLCFTYEDGQKAAIVWRDDTIDVLSFAWRDDGNLPALFEAWQTALLRDD